MIRNMAKKVLDGFASLRSRVINPVDPPIVVLIYHRVTTLQDDPQLLAVTPEHFSAQMQYVKDHFPVLRFEDEWHPVAEPSVVITFDDGYADNLLEALPIIDRVGVPVTFFISSGAIDSDEEFWWDELERLILGPGGRPERCTVSDRVRRLEWPTVSADHRLAFYRELHPILRELPPAARALWLGQVRDWAGCGAAGRPSHRALTSGQLRHMAANSQVTIGAHGVTHTRLSNLSSEEQRQEILHSTRRLGEICGREVTVFSYPFGGRRDYTPETLAICREAGFRRVAANFPGQVHRWSDPFQVPRQLVRNWPLEQFKKKLAGFFVL